MTPEVQAAEMQMVEGRGAELFHVEVREVDLEPEQAESPLGAAAYQVRQQDPGLG